MNETSTSDAVDWNQCWSRRMLHYREIHGGHECFEKWQSRKSALEYWKMAMETQQERIAKTLEDLSLVPGFRVLDIGSGPGVITIPMARKVAGVTAVDASAGMIAVLEEKAAESGLENIDCLHKRWEDVDPEKDLSPPYDIVMASLSLTMADAWAAVSKMQQVCRGHVWLYWFVGEAPWEGHRGVFEPFARKMRQQVTVPKCELLLKILRQNGVALNAEKFRYVHTDCFASIDDVMRHFINRFRIPPERQTDSLRNHVKGLLESCNGNYLLRSEAACMKIWWPFSG
ncbi:MAG: class I SAM-dependent methyltransferase [Desulfobacteraceae bacterium]|nr:class I SAM-dependent methyltransferase [Desulfobacteraceae bacterium]